METMKIISRMSHFRLLSKVSAFSPERIEGEATFSADPLFAGLELLAQTAAMHVRYILQFERHAFLLNVQQCRMPCVDTLIGRYRVQAELCQRSSEAFGYRAKANGPDGADFVGELLIGTRAFDDRFRKEALAAHYQRLWAQLKEV